MRTFTHITLALLFGSSILMAHKPSAEEISSKHTKVIIMDKGVKRTVFIPRDDALKIRTSPMKAEQAMSKDGIIVKFKDASKVSVTAFEAKYNVKLKQKLASGYYIFENSSKLSDLQIVQEVIKNEINVLTVRPNWQMGNKPF